MVAPMEIVCIDYLSFLLPGENVTDWNCLLMAAVAFHSFVYKRNRSRALFYSDMFSFYLVYLSSGIGSVKLDNFRQWCTLTSSPVQYREHWSLVLFCVCPIVLFVVYVFMWESCSLVLLNIFTSAHRLIFSPAHSILSTLTSQTFIKLLFI